jgi:hypothetical protein
MRKLCFLVLSFSWLIALPALADLGQVWTDFQYYSVDLQNYLKNNFTKTFNPLSSPVQINFVNAQGDIAVPDPLTLNENIYNALTLFSRSDRFENNSAVFSSMTEDEIDRLMTLGSVTANLGIGGQLRVKNKLKNTETSLKIIGDFSKQFDDLFTDLQQSIVGLGNAAAIPPTLLAKLTANQANLQLQSVKIQTEQAKMAAETLAQDVLNNQSLQYQNLNLANISQQMAIANRSQRVETAAEAARLLRATAQMDLLGRTQ